MRHRLKTKTLGRNTKSRKALLVNLVRSLFENARIVTTEVKAKEVKRIAEKLLTKAKKANLASRRKLHRFFGKRDVVNKVVDHIVPQIITRKSGYLKLVRGSVRKGDGSLMATLSFNQLDINVGWKNAKTFNNSQVNSQSQSVTKGQTSATDQTSDGSSVSHSSVENVKNTSVGMIKTRKDRLDVKSQVIKPNKETVTGMKKSFTVGMKKGSK